MSRMSSILKALMLAPSTAQPVNPEEVSATQFEIPINFGWTVIMVSSSQGIKVFSVQVSAKKKQDKV
jgi:hypothetical protein